MGADKYIIIENTKPRNNRYIVVSRSKFMESYNNKKYFCLKMKTDDEPNKKFIRNALNVDDDFQLQRTKNTWHYINQLNTIELTESDKDLLSSFRNKLVVPRSRSHNTIVLSGNTSTRQNVEPVQEPEQEDKYVLEDKFSGFNDAFKNEVLKTMRMTIPKTINLSIFKTKDLLAVYDVLIDAATMTQAVKTDKLKNMYIIRMLNNEPVDFRIRKINDVNIRFIQAVHQNMYSVSYQVGYIISDNFNLLNMFLNTYRNYNIALNDKRQNKIDIINGIQARNILATSSEHIFCDIHFFHGTKELSELENEFMPTTRYNIYTDGAFDGAHAYGSAFVVEYDNKILKQFSRNGYCIEKFKRYGVRIAEFTAIIEAIKYVAASPEIDDVTIFSDSFDAIYTLSDINNSKSHIIINKFIQIIDNYVKAFEQNNVTIKFQYVKGHNTNRGNNIADKLAVEAKKSCCKEFFY